MAYADHSEGSSRTVSIIIVALIHAVLGYAFVTGLGYQYVKTAAEKLNVIDVAEEPPPPPEEPPPPPPDRPVEPPPVVSPPPIVQMNTPPPPVTVVRDPPPVFIPTPQAAPPPPPPPPPRPVKALAPRGNPGSWVTSDDYPARALREERSGSVGVRLTVDAGGRVSDCNVTSSSGHSDLDAEACKLLMRRGRFSPAEDASGNKLGGVWSSRFVWRIPE